MKLSQATSATDVASFVAAVIDGVKEPDSKLDCAMYHSVIHEF